jgi:hypothetical protein
MRISLPLQPAGAKLNTPPFWKNSKTQAPPNEGLKEWAGKSEKSFSNFCNYLYGK